VKESAMISKSVKELKVGDYIMHKGYLVQIESLTIQSTNVWIGLSNGNTPSYPLNTTFLVQEDSDYDNIPQRER
jgi:hypothetical protein